MLPKLLENGVARSLSDEIYKKTGCFPFFYPNEEIIIGRPQNDNDSFYYIINGLYILYHDFGKRFLNFFLDDSQSIGSHCKDVGFLRTLIAHGNHNSTAYNNTITIQFCRHFSVGNSRLNWESGFFNSDSMKRDDWEKICQKLVDDSNNLYYHLTKWLEDHFNNDAEEMTKNFHNDNFSISFDSALVKETILYLKDKGLITINGGRDIDNAVKKVIDKKDEWIHELYVQQDSQKTMYNKFVDVVWNVIDPDPTQALLDILHMF